MLARDLLTTAPEVQAAEVWPTPEPLDTSTRLKPWPEGKLLPPALESYGLAFANRLCIDPGPVLLSMLAACSAITGGRVWIEPDRDNPTWVEPTTLWLAVVMGVSTKKTPMLKAALAPVWAIEAELREEHRRALEEYEAALAEWASARRGERGPKPQAPQPERLTASDSTYEALVGLLIGSPSILAFRDELSGLFKGWAREDRRTERAFYLAAYSAAQYPLDRVVRGSHCLERPLVGLLGFIQPGPFRERILEAQSPDGSGADGLLQRFVVVTASERPWVDERPAIPHSLREGYHHLIERTWDTLRARGECTLQFDDEAQAFWYRWEAETERGIRNPDHSEAWKALLGKRLGLTARLAGLLHTILEAPGDAVGVETLKRAVTLVLWLEPHARRIWERALNGNDEPVLKLARKLQGGGLETFTLRDLYRRGVAGIVTAAEARRVVEALAEAGWVVPDPQDRNRYRVNPRVREVGHV